MKVWPTQGRKGQRAGLRQEIRNGLGTSRSAAPSLPQVLRATERMNRLIRLTTNGAYRIRVERVCNGQWDTRTAHELLTMDADEWSE